MIKCKYKENSFFQIIPFYYGMENEKKTFIIGFGYYGLHFYKEEKKIRPIGRLNDRFNIVPSNSKLTPNQKIAISMIAIASLGVAGALLFNMVKRKKNGK